MSKGKYAGAAAIIVLAASCYLLGKYDSQVLGTMLDTKACLYEKSREAVRGSIRKLYEWTHDEDKPSNIGSIVDPNAAGKPAEDLDDRLHK